MSLMVVPELNPEHQSDRGTAKAIGDEARAHCSQVQLLHPELCAALHPLRGFGLERVLVCTYQAISGAGRPSPPGRRWWIT